GVGGRAWRANGSGGPRQGRPRPLGRRRRPGVETRSWRESSQRGAFAPSIRADCPVYAAQEGMARIRIVDEWLRSPASPATFYRSIMVVADAWAEQRVLMRAHAQSVD